MVIRYTIKLTKSEVEELQVIITKGSHTSQTFRAAYILLNCDEGKYSDKVTNEQISKVLKVGMRTIDRVKKQFIEEGMEAVLERRSTTRIYEVKIIAGHKLIRLWHFQKAFKLCSYRRQLYILASAMLRNRQVCSKNIHGLPQVE